MTLDARRGVVDAARELGDPETADDPRSDMPDDSGQRPPPADPDPQPGPEEPVDELGGHRAERRVEVRVGRGDDDPGKSEPSRDFPAEIDVGPTRRTDLDVDDALDSGRA